MKRANYRIVAFFVALILLGVANIGRVYSETPVIPVEDDANVYLSQIVDVPPVDDPRWELIPKEEMATQMQFLVDQQNSNYDRIQTWKGKYYQIRKSDFGGVDNQVFVDRSSIPAKLLYEDLFTFVCDIRKDRGFLRLDRLYEQYYDKSGAAIEKPMEISVDTDLCGLLTKDQYIRYEFGLDQIRGELEGVMPGRIGKVCVSMPAEEQRDISRIGTLFDPRLFFHSGFHKTFDTKTWYNLEGGFIPWLRGECDKKALQRALDGLTVFKGDFSGVIWYRVDYREDDGTLRCEYVFNSESNFNMVLSRECEAGVPFMTVGTKYRADADIYVPEQCVFIWDKGDSYRYFKHIESVLNEKIPSDQFALEALGLDPDVVVLDEAKEVSYKYVNGKLKPIAEFGASESYVENKSFWSSPARIVAFVVGLTLIAFGVVRRFRKRRAQS